MHILVVAEHDNKQIRPASLSALEFARQINGDDDRIGLLLMGQDIGAVAESSCNYAHAVKADHELLANPLPDRYAAVIAHVVQTKAVDAVVAASTAWAKDIVGRAAGLLGGTMASDVVAHEMVDGTLQLQRPMYAGSLLATVVLHGSPQIITIRSSAYGTALPLDAPLPIIDIDVDAIELPTGSTFEGQTVKGGDRPDVTDARIVVSGGRGIKSTEDYERLVGTLADKLGAATGSSRALVDAGITTSELQVGQTGKAVAPDLYLALGISGAIQHLAGMKNSKTVAAICSDPDAPIFKASDYGLVGDVYDLVPELIEKLP